MPSKECKNNKTAKTFLDIVQIKQFVFRLFVRHRLKQKEKLMTDEQLEKYKVLFSIGINIVGTMNLLILFSITLLIEKMYVKIDLIKEIIVYWVNVIRFWIEHLKCCYNKRVIIVSINTVHYLKNQVY